MIITLIFTVFFLCILIDFLNLLSSEIIKVGFLKQKIPKYRIICESIWGGFFLGGRGIPFFWGGGVPSLELSFIRFYHFVNYKNFMVFCVLEMFVLQLAWSASSEYQEWQIKYSVIHLSYHLIYLYAQTLITKNTLNKDLFVRNVEYKVILLNYVIMILSCKFRTKDKWCLNLFYSCDGNKFVLYTLPFWTLFSMHMHLSGVHYFNETYINVGPHICLLYKLIYTEG